MATATLNGYLTQVETLLHDLFNQFYTTATLTGFINQARQQIALEGECVRQNSLIATVPNMNAYLNSGVSTPSTPSGIAGPLTSIREIKLAGGFTPNGGQPILEKRNWDWFQFYELGMAARPAGLPQVWAPQSLGSNGVFYIAPVPTSVATLNVDGNWGVIDLALNSDPEAIPYPWTDAVQWYAVWLALSDAQRMEDAHDAYSTYETYMERARGIVTPQPAQRAYPGGLASRRVQGQAQPNPANNNAPGGRQQ